MKNFLRSIKDDINKRAYICILIILIIIPILHYFFYNYEKDMLENQIRLNEESYKESIWCDIEEVIILAQTCAKLSAIDTAKDIKHDLIDNNMHSLQMQKNLEDVDYPKEFVDIIYKNIQDKYLFGLESKSNSVIVIDSNTIIFDGLPKVNGLHMKSLSEEERNQYNKILMYNTLKNIMDYKLNNLLFIEPYSPLIDDHIIIHESNINKLKEVFINEGFNGLIGYVILNPVYMSSLDGDICIDETHVDCDYNLIVIQKFSLYEVLQINMHNLYIKENIFKMHNSTIDEKIKALSITYSCVVILDIIALIILLLYGTKRHV